MRPLTLIFFTLLIHFNGQIAFSQCVENEVLLSFVFDNYPEEIGYFITNSTGIIVAEAAEGSFEGETNSVQSLCLPNGCYTLSVTDLSGDGMCCTYGQGSYTLMDSIGTVLVTGGEFGAIESYEFCLGDGSIPGCTSPEACNYNPEATVNDESCATEIVTISITNNYWSSETSFTVFNAETEEAIASMSGSYGNFMDIIEDVCLVADACYYLTVYDSYGDGIGLEGVWTISVDGIMIDSGGGPDWDSQSSDIWCFGPGCTDESACNFDVLATADEGTCDYSCWGCTNAFACNFNPEATYEDGSCELITCVGCTDFAACNFDPAFTIDDGSCDFSCLGCTDEFACNFVVTATEDDGSCDYSCIGCFDPTACNYNPDATAEGDCYYDSCVGCMDDMACNFDSSATQAANEECDYSCNGCLDPAACNYNPLAGNDDGSCEYSSCYVTMGDSLIVGGVCGYHFTDNGGPLNPYGNNYQITTICPDVPGEAISVFFEAFSLQNIDNNPDQLIIYDGFDAQSPILAVGESSNLFGMLVSATEANPSGCLTFQLLPNWPPNEFAPGWSAEIICSAPCPQSTASFSTDAAPFSASNPQLVGCPASPIEFSSEQIEGIAPVDWVWIVDYASAFYSETGDWSHTFETGGNHTVQHYVVDENGCPSSPSPVTTLAISPFPAYEIQVTTPLCVASEGQIFMNETDFFSNEEGAIFGTDEELPIPDATGAWFESEIVIDQFADGQLLEDCSNLFAINALMEHSFVGDLTIQVECPNGTQVMVMENNNSGGDGCNGGGGDLNGYYLGEPDDFDGTTPNPGVGYWYSFTEDGEYVLDDANNPNVTGYTIPAGEYGLCGDICDFVGCPLNGVWTFQVIDQWGADNGYLFEWNLEFNPSITADYTEFPPIAVVDDVSGWDVDSNASNVTWASGNGDSLLVEYTQPGSFIFTYEMTNNFGCSFDTTVVIEVEPNEVATIDAGDDLIFCSDSLQLDVNFMESDQANCSSDAGTYSYCYGSNVFETFTYCPDEPGDGTMMSIHFQSGSVQAFWDALVVYDGDSDSAPVLAALEGDLTGMGFTATNPGGCLTLTFSSDGWGDCISGEFEEAVWCVSCGGPTPCAFDWQWEPAEAFVDAQVQNPLLHSALQDSMMVVVSATPYDNDICSARDTLWVIQNSDCFGCTDPEACNFVGLDITDDGSCTYPGCTDAAACNFDPLAGCNDLSCLFDIGESAFCDNFGWEVDSVFQLPMVPVLLELPLTIPLVNEEFIAGFELAFNGPSQFTLDSLPAGTYRIQASGTWCGGNCSGSATSDAAFAFSDATGSIDPIPLELNTFTVNTYCPQGVTTCDLLRPVPDIYQFDHVYDYFIDHPGGQMNIYGLADECCWWDNFGGLAFEVYFVNDLCEPEILWSTGETTESISFVSDSSEWVWVELTGGGWSCTDSIWFETSDYIAGCTDSAACNYDPSADMDNGSCYYEPCTFCSDESACNYNPGSSTLIAETWDFDGAIMQFFQVPDGVYTLNVTVAGARGGGANAGHGSIVQGDLAVVPGDVLGITVGESGGIPTGGFNGGANGGPANTEANSGGGGGGATDIRVAPFGLEQRIVVAAGGGGQGGGNTDSNAGYGGCEAGGDGDSPFGEGGGGATQTAGGIGGAPWIAQGAAGLTGTFGVGGAGGADPCYNVGPGGGGGGGYFGGGGGGTDCFASGTLGGGGGGGGSSLYPSGMSCSGNASSGNGYLVIEYALPLDESCDYSCQCTGDLNGDGFVNVSDILILLGGFGCEAPPACDSDANGDGFTNVADLLVVLGAFGTQCE